MRTAPQVVMASVLTGLVIVMSTSQDVVSQQPAPGGVAVAAGYGTNLDALRQWDAAVDRMTHTGGLVVMSRRGDRALAGRTHEYLAQVVAGIPVYGGGMTRQLDRGVTVSLFGTLHQGIALDLTPQLSAPAASAAIARQAGTGPATDQPPTLVILPTLDDRYVLAYRATMRNLRTYFLDANSGAIVHEERVVDEQQAVGVGRGIQGQQKKVSASQRGGRFETYDRLRPAEIVTLDLRYDEARSESLLDPFEASWVPSDVASDTDNAWADAAVVDGHVYAGFTYDYLVAQHGWHGMDGWNGRIMTMVNIGDEANAFFAPPPFGPEGSGVIAFGQFRDGTPLVAAEIVAHELMHGVTYFSVSQRTGSEYGLLDTVDARLGPESFTFGGRTFRCGELVRIGELLRISEGPIESPAFQIACRDGRFLLASNHGGALNEAYSDIIGTAVEFSLHEPAVGALRADYVVGEDTGLIIRSLENPRSMTLGEGSVISFPDAYSAMVRFLVGEVEVDGELFFFFLNLGSVDGRTIVELPSFGYDGVHWNSTILSHAFYLAIEGGQNATTGASVGGAGGVNRAIIEQIFFRAMTDLMPAAPSFPIAAAVIRQSAADLAAGSAAQQAIDQALWAVGL